MQWLTEAVYLDSHRRGVAFPVLGLRGTCSPLSSITLMFIDHSVEVCTFKELIPTRGGERDACSLRHAGLGDP